MQGQKIKKGASEMSAQPRGIGPTEQTVTASGTHAEDGGDNNAWGLERRRAWDVGLNGLVQGLGEGGDDVWPGFKGCGWLDSLPRKMTWKPPCG